MKELSIIIPTYNRNEYLKDLLNSIKKQNLENIEVIIVDNTFNNNALKIKEEYKDFIFVHEVKPGVSNARNLGALKATGNKLCFLDDDEEIEEGFIASALEFNGKVAIGKTNLNYLSEKPSWIDSKLENYLSKIDYGEKEKFLKNGEWITAGNLIIKKDCF